MKANQLKTLAAFTSLAVAFSAVVQPASALTVPEAITSIQSSNPTLPSGVANPKGNIGFLLANMFWNSSDVGYDSTKFGKIKPTYFDGAGATAWTYAGGNTYLTDVATGNVGIWTNSPNASLEVKRAAADTNFAAWIEGLNSGNYGLGVNIANTSSAKSIADFRSGNVSRLYIAGNGYVGIWNSSPEAAMHVVWTWLGDDDVNLDSYGLNEGALFFRASGGTKESPAPVVSGRRLWVLSFKGYDGTWFQDLARIQSIAESTATSTWGAADLRFYTKGWATWTERLRISAYWNVGIWMTNPDRALHVWRGSTTSSIRFDGFTSPGQFTNLFNSYGWTLSDFGSLIEGADNGQVVVALKDNDGNDGFRIVSGGGNFMSDGVYDTTVLTALPGGNVGIGTGTPGARLEVAWQIKITWGSPAEWKILTSDSGGLASWESPSSVYSESDPKVGTLANGYVPVWNSGSLVNTNLYANTSNGNLGIGHTGGRERLDVAGNMVLSSGNIFLSHDSAANTNNDYIKIDDTNGLELGWLGGAFSVHVDSPRWLTWTWANAAIAAGGWYFAKLVGIGTSTPAATLEAKRWTDDANYAAWFEGTKTNNYGLGVNIANTSSGKSIADFKSWNVSRMVVKGDGNVGIGTSSPNSLLQIGAAMYFGEGGINGDAVTWSDIRFAWVGVVSSEDALYFNMDSDSTSTTNAFIVGKDRETNAWGTELFRIAESGNVGIGNAAPAYTLDVTGNVNMTGNVGIGSWTPTSTKGINLDIDVANNTGYGLYSNVTATGTFTAARSYFGTYNIVTNLAENGAFSNAAYGSYNYALNTSAATGTGAKSLFGSYSYARNYSTWSTIANAYGGYFTVWNTYGTITNGYGVYIGNVDGAAATTYGLYQSDAAGKNYFAGSVGIGNTAPAASFEVKRTAVDSNYVTWLEGANVNNYGLGVNILNTTSNRSIADFQSANVSRLFVRGDGNVGIGTSTPGAKLEVAGQIKITGGSPGAGKVLTSDASGLATWATPASGGGITAATTASCGYSETTPTCTATCPAGYFRTGCSAGASNGGGASPSWSYACTFTYVAGNAGNGYAYCAK